MLGPGKLLRRAIQADRLFSSIILWGPPGTGKTTLAMVIANQTQIHFETLSAVLAGKAELRVVIDAALERRKLYAKETILFVDEVHRWNKAQQDALAAACRERHIHLDRRHHGKSVFRSDRRSGFTLARIPTAPLTDEDMQQVLDSALRDPRTGLWDERR